MTEAIVEISTWRRLIGLTNFVLQPMCFKTSGMPNSMAMVDDAAVQTIKDLASAVSTQAQVSNRTWLGLLTVAAFALLPQAPNVPQPHELTLPFGFPPVDAVTYNVTLFLLLVVLAIAFSAAQAQTVRAQMLAQSFLNSLADRSIKVAGMDPRELFDMLRLPSINRVASLAQSLRGRYQFYRDERNCPGYLRFASTVYYILLRLTSLVVYYGLPAAALWQAHARIQVAGFYLWLLTAVGLLSGITLLEMFVIDSRYSIRVVQIIAVAYRRPLRQ
jgi:hypothetical protein